MTWKELGIGLLIFTILTIVAFGLASAVWAQTETGTVSVQPQDLSTALKDVPEQTHLQVLYASKLTEGQITKACRERCRRRMQSAPFWPIRACPILLQTE